MNEKRGRVVSSSVRHWLVLAGVLLLTTGMLSACSFGSSDPDPTSTSNADLPTSTSEPIEREPTATETSTPTPTVTPVPPTATQTATPSPTPTVTPIPRVPIGETTPLDPAVITNYTLTTDLKLRGISGQTDFLMGLLILQAAPNHYYLKSTTGGSGIESWLVDGTTYLTQADGSVARLPQGSDTALFSPALLIQTIPTISSETVGIEVGVEEVNGRQTTHFRVDGRDLFESTPWLPREETSDVRGTLDIWIDNDTRLVIRRETDVHWKNMDGSDGSFVDTYDLTNITTTEPVTAPG